MDTQGLSTYCLLYSAIIETSQHLVKQVLLSFQIYKQENTTVEELGHLSKVCKVGMRVRALNPGSLMVIGRALCHHTGCPKSCASCWELLG